MVRATAADHEGVDQRALQAEHIGKGHDDHAPDQGHGPEDGEKARVGLQEAFLPGVSQFV
jgi:hypothetical protein